MVSRRQQATVARPQEVGEVKPPTRDEKPFRVRHRHNAVTEEILLHARDVRAKRGTSTRTRGQA